MILVIDNYDSFTFNLFQYLHEVNAEREEIRVVRNDATSINDIRTLAPTRIVISPGPCTPNEAGVSLEIFRELSGQLPILGVCLGHQALGQAFGAKVIRARVPMHGKVSKVIHDGNGIFEGIPSPTPATRYHSLIVEEKSLPDCLHVTARSDDGEIMALTHRQHAQTIGVQFHPESIMTPAGKKLLANFLALDHR